MELGSEMKVTLAQLRILLAVVRARSVGAAARELGLTQSGVSQAIIALEKALGVDLLTRTRDGVTPTAFALTILQDAGIASDAVRRIVGRARAAVSAPARPLRIASVPSVAERLLPGWSKSFRRLYPEIELSVFEGNHLEIGEWVTHGVADVGLTAIVPAGLSAEYVREEELLIVAPHHHSLLRSESVRVGDLRSATLVTAGYGCDQIVERIFQSAGLQTPHVVRAQDTATALKMVRQGIGVTILPESALPRRGMSDLRARNLSPRAHRHLYMVTLPDTISSDPAWRFQDVVKAWGKAPPVISSANA
jgi:DNA-binding transcriptional LysR family regulator